VKRRRLRPPEYEAILIHVRQDGEDIFTSLYVAPPTVQGLVGAVSIPALFPRVFLSLFLGALCTSNSNLVGSCRGKSKHVQCIPFIEIAYLQHLFYR